MREVIVQVLKTTVVVGKNILHDMKVTVRYTRDSPMRIVYFTRETENMQEDS